tara:strand:- start:209 stop:373 length:165 start_codon:yes stop_codon:yes gene_type:complete
MKYIIIKKHKSLELIKLNNQIMGGYYAVKCDKQKKSKTGLNLDAALEIFNQFLK